MIDILYLSLLFLLILFFYFLIKGFSRNILVFFFLVTVIVFPKINIVTIGTSLNTAGIRVDDFIILSLSIYVLINPKSYLSFKFIQILKLLLIFLFFTFLSIITGVFVGLNDSILFSLFVIVRYFEYFCVAIITYATFRNINNSEETIIRHVVYFIVLFFAVISSLQIFGFANYYVSGSEADNFFEGIAVATFNGYYEYGCFMAFMVYYFLLRYSKVGYLFAFICFTQVLLSQSRVSLVASVISIVFFFLKYYKNNKKKNIRFGLILTGTCILIVFFILFSGDIEINALDRFKTINFDKIVSDIKYYWETADFNYYLGIVKNNLSSIHFLNGSSNDLSLSIRFFKWSSSFKGFLQYPLFGYGPGVTGIMDSSVMKLLVEHGILGILLWYYILYRCVKFTSSNFFKGITLILCISAVMIDTFEASKVMEFYWFSYGFSLCLKDNSFTTFQNIKKGIIATNSSLYYRD